MAKEVNTVKVDKEFKLVKVDYHNTSTTVLRWKNIALTEYGCGDSLVWYPVTEGMTTKEIIDGKGCTEILWNDSAKPSDILDFLALHCEDIEVIKAVLDILAELHGERRW